MSIIILFLLLLIINFLYKRYIPVYGIGNIDFDKIYGKTDAILLDVRDIQAAHRYPVEGTENIQYAYLRRNHAEIEKKDIYLMASTMMDINLSTRFLKRKGFSVKGYYIKSDKNTNVKKGEIQHGIYGTNEE